MAQQQRDIGAEDLARLGRQQYTYGFGGGTIGGNIWNWRQPTTMERLSGRNELIPELRPELRGRVNVMPAGRGSAQELQSMREAGGRPYVEAPELYRRGGGKSQLDRSDQFYSTVTGRPMGTLMGTGSYGGFGRGPNKSQRSWSNYVGDSPIANRVGTEFYKDSPFYRSGGRGGPQPESSDMSGSGQMTPSSGGGPQPAQGTSIPPVVPERSLGISSETPLSFTGFGRATGESAYRTPTIPQTVPSPLPRGTTETLTSFSGIPRFPFAGY